MMGHVMVDQAANVFSIMPTVSILVAAIENVFPFAFLHLNSDAKTNYRSSEVAWLYMRQI